MYSSYVSWIALLGALLIAVPRFVRRRQRDRSDCRQRQSVQNRGTQHIPEITVKAGEQILLRITAHRGKSWNRDGSIHGFTLLRAKDRTKVDGWDLLFKPGTQEFLSRFPANRAHTRVVCTVICSEDHEGMHMKLPCCHEAIWHRSRYESKH